MSEGRIVQRSKTRTIGKKPRFKQSDILDMRLF